MSTIISHSFSLSLAHWNTNSFYLFVHTQYQALSSTHLQYCSHPLALTNPFTLILSLSLSACLLVSLTHAHTHSLCECRPAQCYAISCTHSHTHTLSLLYTRTLAHATIENVYNVTVGKNWYKSPANCNGRPLSTTIDFQTTTFENSTWSPPSSEPSPAPRARTWSTSSSP